MKEKIRFIVMLTLIGVGTILAIWGAIIFINYPGMRELHRQALHAAAWQYGIAIMALIIAWILSYFERKSNMK